MDSSLIDNNINTIDNTQRTADISTRNDSIYLNRKSKIKNLKRSIQQTMPESDNEKVNYKKFKTKVILKNSIILNNKKKVDKSESQYDSNKLSDDIELKTNEKINQETIADKNYRVLQKMEQRFPKRLGTIQSSHHESESPDIYETKTSVFNKLIYLYDNDVKKIKLVKQDTKRSRNKITLSNLNIESDNHLDDSQLKKIDEKIEDKKFNLIKKSIYFTLENIEDKLNSTTTTTRKSKDYFFFLKHMLKDKVCDMLFLKSDIEENMDFNQKSEELRLYGTFREHLLENNFNFHSPLIDKIIKKKYLHKEEEQEQELTNSFTLKVPPCLVSPSAKRDSLYRKKHSRFGRLTKILHPSDFGDANMIHYNKHLILDRDSDICNDNTDFIFDDSDESSLNYIKNNLNTMPEFHNSPGKLNNSVPRKSKIGFAMTSKPGANMLSSRRSIKIILNSKDVKKSNSEFLPYKKFNKKKADDLLQKQERISILDNKDFFNIIKVDPELDK
jgi:hypothetical protein